MKKCLMLSSVLLVCITGLFAQKDDDKLVRFGVRAGFNYNKFYGDDFSGNKIKNDFQPGFHAGITADLLVTPTFFIQPALLYSMKGAKNNSTSIKITQNISYIELPINLIFKPELGGGRLLLGAGPYIAYGIAGKQKAKSGNTSQEFDAKFKNTISGADYLNNSYFYAKPLDYGANALVGYELNNGFSIQVNGQLGLNKINPKIDGVTTEINKTNLKNLGAGISLAYKF